MTKFKVEYQHKTKTEIKQKLKRQNTPMTETLK